MTAADEPTVPGRDAGIAGVLEQHAWDGRLGCMCGEKFSRRREPGEVGFIEKFDDAAHRTHLAALLADLPGDAGALDEAGVRADERAKTGARIADAIDDFSPYPIEHVAAFAEAARIARADAQGDGGGR